MCEIEEGSKFWTIRTMFHRKHIEATFRKSLDVDLANSLPFLRWWGKSSLAQRGPNDNFMTLRATFIDKKGVRNTPKSIRKPSRFLETTKRQSSLARHFMYGTV